jgi:hypothetical protein
VRTGVGASGNAGVSGGSGASGAPSGREGRLWRVVVDLSVAVEDAVARHAERLQAGSKPELVAPGSGTPVAGPSAALVQRRLEQLVVEFDDAYTVFVEGMESLPAEASLVALQAVDRQLAAMVRAQDAELWSERALREDARWHEAQRLAFAVIEIFDWPFRRLAVVREGTGAGAAESQSGVAPQDGVPGRSR